MIRCQDITKTYKGVNIETKALKGVSFSIKDGEFVAIMGPSGSGKSTLMHILGCLDTPTSGQFLFGGKDVSKLSDDELVDHLNEFVGRVGKAIEPYLKAIIVSIYNLKQNKSSWHRQK